MHYVAILCWIALADLPYRCEFVDTCIVRYSTDYNTCVPLLQLYQATITLCPSDITSFCKRWNEELQFRNLLECHTSNYVTLSYSI